MAHRTATEDQGPPDSHCINTLLSQYKLQLTDANPHLLAWMEPSDVRIWYFLAGGVPEPYLGGEYIFKLTAPNAFPHKPPRFEFITPNGVFQPGGPICISVGEWHADDKPMKDKTAPGAYGWRASLGMMGFATQVVNGMICPDTLESGIRIMASVPVEMRTSHARVSRAFNRGQYPRLYGAFEEIVEASPDREAVRNIVDSRFRLAGKPIPPRALAVTQVANAKNTEDAEDADDVDVAKAPTDAPHGEQNDAGLLAPTPTPARPAAPQKPAPATQQPARPKPPPQPAWKLSPALQALMRMHAQKSGATALVPAPVANLASAPMTASIPGSEPAVTSTSIPGSEPAVASTSIPGSEPAVASTASTASTESTESTEVVIALAMYDGHNQEDSMVSAPAPAPVPQPAPALLPGPAPLLTSPLLAPAAALDPDFAALLGGFDDAAIPADDSAELPTLAPATGAGSKDDDLTSLIDSLLDE